jgi:hypothetical protein
MARFLPLIFQLGLYLLLLLLQALRLTLHFQRDQGINPLQLAPLSLLHDDGDVGDGLRNDAAALLARALPLPPPRHRATLFRLEPLPPHV